MSLSVEDYFSDIKSILFRYLPLLDQLGVQYEKLTPLTGYLKAKSQFEELSCSFSNT